MVRWVKSTKFSSTLTSLEGDGSGFGFNLSAMYVKDALSLGVSFHSAATVNLEGFYTALNPTLVEGQIEGGIAQGFGWGVLEGLEFHDGRGFGHGVGLCQWGAQGMAAEGKTAEDILQFYYPGAVIVRSY